MKAFVVSNNNMDEAIPLLQKLGFNNVQVEKSHDDAVRSCTTSKSRCLITDGGIGIGNQSLEHVKHELSTIGNTSDLVIFSSGNISSYVMTPDMAQSINILKLGNRTQIDSMCADTNCEYYSNTQMAGCEGNGLFQMCS
tara:strand:- start:2130 stop:2546 length:417 start_codon:yes stop_codon:yes gene_type:complete